VYDFLKVELAGAGEQWGHGHKLESQPFIQNGSSDRPFTMLSNQLKQWFKNLETATVDSTIKILNIGTDMISIIM
jgi:hypothetical protein